MNLIYSSSFEFAPYWITKKWDGDNQIFKDLLLNMLGVNFRFSIVDVINHKFFDGVRDNLFDNFIFFDEDHSIPDDIFQHALTITDDISAISYAYKLYKSLLEDKKFTLETCIHLSWKILYNKGFRENLTYFEYNEEIRLVKDLGYNIYVH